MKSKTIKYGKKFEDILKIKKNFFDDNDSLIKKQKKNRKDILFTIN